jgi:hypothetical protein
MRTKGELLATCQQQPTVSNILAARREREREKERDRERERERERDRERQRETEELSATS